MSRLHYHEPKASFPIETEAEGFEHAPNADTEVAVSVSTRPFVLKQQVRLKQRTQS
jgi:hypothetical protein